MARKQGRNAYRRELVEEFKALLPRELFRRLDQHGNTAWTARVTVCLGVLMYWVDGQSLQERFSAARRIVKLLWPHWHVPVSYAGFVEAQQRWWPHVLPLLLEQLRPDCSLGPAWRVHDWLVLAVDGSRFECPRTMANERELGCAGRDRTSPQVFMTLLQHVGTGLPWDFRLGPGTDSESRHLKDMLGQLPEQTLLTADAGFVSYDLCWQLMALQSPFVLRMGANKTLLTNLEDDPHADPNIAYFWPRDRHSSPPLKLRRIRFVSSGGLPVELVTNVLDKQRLSDEDAQAIYRSRWGIEVYFRHLKQTMNFTQLQSRTPDNAQSEQGWKVISFWMLQRMVVGHQIAGKQDPRRFSAAKARRHIRDVLQRVQTGQRGKSFKRLCLEMQVDSYTRSGPKCTRPYPRKKNDKPPKPPKIKLATPAEIQKAKQLGYKFLLIS